MTDVTDAPVDEAEKLRQAIAAAPQDPALYLELGKLLRDRNDISGARSILEAGLRISENDVPILKFLARVENVSRNHHLSEKHLRRALELAPGDKRSITDLAGSLLRQVKFDEATAVLRAALADSPDYAAFHSQLGYILRWQGINREAEKHLLRAIELSPKDAAAMLEMAMIHEEEGDFEPAIEWHQRAVAIKGAAYAPTSFCSALLAAGRSGTEAWGMNRNRVEFPAFASLMGEKLWQGQPLEGKSIFVVTEGGAGDQIRDACCLAELADRAAAVTVSLEPRFTKLFERSFPNIRFMPCPRQERIASYDRMLSRLVDDAAFSEMKQHDYAILSPDLFCYFRKGAEDWGRQRSFLTASPELVEKWRGRLAALGDGPKIGISWRSQRLFNRVAYHTELTDWDPILGRPGAHFVNLQYDESGDEIRAAEDKYGIRIAMWDDLDLRNDFDDIAGLVSSLDAVLAPNTAILEFTGALGTNALYLNRVPIAYDHWRRKDDSGQDRMYPSVTQVRGARPYETEPLITAAASKLWSMVGR